MRGVSMRSYKVNKHAKIVLAFVPQIVGFSTAWKLSKHSNSRQSFINLTSQTNCFFYSLKTTYNPKVFEHEERE